MANNTLRYLILEKRRFNSSAAVTQENLTRSNSQANNNKRPLVVKLKPSDVFKAK